MKTEKGFSEMLILVAIVAVFAALFIIFLPKSSLLNQTTPPVSYETIPSPSPISESADITTLEEEFSSTTTESVDADIDSMNLDAESL
jgi:hypothetical protein